MYQTPKMGVSNYSIGVDESCEYMKLTRLTIVVLRLPERTESL